MSFRPKDRVFVDESKSRGYYIAAAAIQPFDTTSTERAIRSLLKRGQRRIHFKSESSSRRRALLAEFARLGLQVTVYQARTLDDRQGRSRCLTALVSDLVRDGASELFIEQDDSLVLPDRRLIRTELANLSALDQLTYHHVRPAEYPLLWVSDAAAWCHQAGGEWLKRVEPMITELRKL